MEIKRILAVMGKATYQAVTDKGTIIMTLPRSTPMEEVQQLFQERYESM